MIPMSSNRDLKLLIKEALTIEMGKLFQSFIIWLLKKRDLGNWTSEKFLEKSGGGKLPLYSLGANHAIEEYVIG